MVFKNLFVAAMAVFALVGTSVPANAATFITTNTIGVIQPGHRIICDGVTDCGGRLTGNFINFFTSIPGIAAALPGNNTSQIAVLGGNTARLAINQWLRGFSFDIGSIDGSNVFTIINGDGGMLTFHGSLFAPANGDQSSSATNRRISVDFSDLTFVSALLIGSGQNSSETDNYATFGAAIPEPATWAMMLLGFGAVGVSLRRRTNRTVLA